MHIGHLALRVTKLDEYVDHISETLGLNVLVREGDEAYLSSHGLRHELQLISDDVAGFDHVGLVLGSRAELDAAVEQAAGAGGIVTEDRSGEPGISRAVKVTGPGQITYQLYLPAESSPTALAQHLGTDIRRFGHLTFSSSEAEALIDFWRDGLGFRLSDRAFGFTWMRCDAYHHSLAVGPHPDSTTLHHHAWEIQDMAALSKHCDLNGLARRPQMWGPVRHGPGFNIATYMPDAAGAIIEVYTDLLTIADDENYAAMDWSDEPLALNLWGVMPPPEFFTAGLPVLRAEAAVQS